MSSKKVFCIVPWTTTHLYWDGTYGSCCSESKKLTGTQYNVKNTNIVEWHNSTTMQYFRERMLGDSPLPECSNCYKDEAINQESRRIKENFKAAIFTEKSFDRSFVQSDWNPWLTSSTDILPIDWHIDFGNECNLACKMCGPSASSKIAQQYTKWNIQYDKQANWHNDDTSWEQFLNNIKHVDGLHRIHIMGGEPVINKKFHQFVNWMIDNEHTDVGLSFVSNGTIIHQELIDKLKLFREVDVEISLESIHPNNHYIRQGSITSNVLHNIENLINQQSDTFKLVLRSVPQLLSINNYHEYILYAFRNSVSIQSLPLHTPNYLAVPVLPYAIRQSFKENYLMVKNTILKETPDKIKTITTGRDTSRLGQQLVRECDMVIEMLDAVTPANVEQLRNELISWLVLWDKAYSLDAREFYPEYREFLEHYNYAV